jgi:hypothetical protein
VFSLHGFDKPLVLNIQLIEDSMHHLSLSIIDSSDASGPSPTMAPTVSEKFSRVAPSASIETYSSGGLSGSFSSEDACAREKTGDGWEITLVPAS